MTEIQKYRVLDSFKGIEIREYEPHMLVSIKTGGSFNQAGYNAFGYLAGYISGRNKANQNIAMTAPVIQKPVADGYEVSFVMPADMGPGNTPAPESSLLALKHEDSKRIAAIRFSGMASDANFAAHREKLLKVLAERNIDVTGEVFFARYNGPWTPAFARRNEALVEIAN